MVRRLGKLHSNQLTREATMKAILTGLVLVLTVVLGASMTWAACENLRKEVERESVRGVASGMARLGAGLAGSNDYNSIMDRQRENNQANYEFALRLQQKQEELDDCRRDAEQMEKEDQDFRESMDKRYRR
jgi:predicted nuclease with TOPRIM domain